jgi:signal transduction histidine kinase
MKTPVPWYNRTSIPLAVALFFGFLGWVLYTTLEAFFFPTTPFLQLFLTDIPLPDLILRIIVSGCFFIFGVILIDTIARQRYREKTLKDTNETLNLRIIALEQQIKEKTVEVESLLQQKNDLIVGLSHDLNTPLTPLMGFLPLIIKDEKDQKLKELLEISLRNVHYIRDLVSKAIDLALLDSTILGLTVEKTNLSSEIENILENKSTSLQANHLFVDNHIDEHLFVNVDKLKLREVLNNILTNSITYSSPEGGTITLDANRTQNEIVVSIADTGVGLTPEQIHHIFDELYKGDTARHNHKKTGLGLTICKRIVEKHGGKIWAESKGLGKGTTVYFTVPTLQENGE